MSTQKIQSAAHIVFQSFMVSPDSTSFTWHLIVKQMTDAGVKVGNWLNVRSVLQYYIDRGDFVRTSNFMVEEYLVTKWMVDASGQTKVVSHD